MRTVLRILLFPVIAVLTLFVTGCQIISQLSNIVLLLFTFLLLILALAVMLLQDTSSGVCILGLAFLISPFGIPLIITFLIELLGLFKDILKEI